MSKSFSEKRKPPLFVLAVAILVIFLGVTWVISQQTKKLDDVSVGGASVGELAPVPAPANFVDRSAGETFRLDRVAQRDGTIKMFGGDVTIQGNVLSSTGERIQEVAVVELVRWRGDAYNAVRVNTNSSGEFKLEDVYGGRWSVRAWLPGKFASRGATPIFLIVEEVKQLEVFLGSEKNLERTLTVSPEQTTFSTATVTLAFVDRVVDENGRLVDVLPSGAYSIQISDKYNSSKEGILVEGGSTFTVSCIESDEENVTLILPEERKGVIKFGDETFEFILPVCVPPPTTTTSTTTTTIPPAPTTLVPPTTSTTLPRPTTTVSPTTIVRPTTTVPLEGE